MLRFGYDVFISYARRDAQQYAQELFRAIDDRGFAPFIDSVETVAGASTPASVLRKLRRASMMVVLLTKHAAHSKAIAEEIEIFRRTRRNIIIVDCATDSEERLTSTDPPIWSSFIEGLPQHREAREAFAAGRPSERIVDVILSGANFVRRAIKLRRSVTAAAVSGAAFIGGALVYSSAIVSEAETAAHRARIGTELEQDGADALRRFEEGEQIEALVLAMQSARRLEALEGADIKVASKLSTLPATSPIQALLAVVPNIRERNLLARYEDTYLRMRYSPDGKTILASSEARGELIELFDATTGRSRARLQTERQGMQDYDFSPDSTLVATAGLGLVRLWSSDDGGVARTLSEDDGYFYEIRFSPDGSLVAAGHEDRVRVWTVQTGEEQPSYRTDGTPVWHLAFSRDGRSIVGGNYDYVFVWDLDGGWKAPAEPHAVETDVFSIAPGPAVSDSLASDPKDNDAAPITEASLLGYGAVLDSLAVSGDGRIVAQVDGNRALRLWDVAQQAEITVPGLSTDGGRRARVGNVDFASDGARFLLTRADGTMMLYALPRAQPIFTLAAHEDYFDARFSPDGEYVVSGGEDGEVKLWRVRPTWPLVSVSRKISRYRGRRDGRLLSAGLRLSPDGRILADLLGGKAVTVWDVTTGEEFAFEHPIDVSALSVSDGEVTIAGTDGSVATWDIRTGQQIAALPGPGSEVSVQLSRNGQAQLLESRATGITVRDTRSGEVIHRLEPSDGSRQAWLTPDAKKLLLTVSTWSPEMQIVDLGTGNLLQLQGGLSNRGDFEFVGGSELLIVRSSDAPFTQLFDLNTGTPVPFGLGDALATEIAIGPLGQLVASNSGPSVVVWDMEGGTRRALPQLFDFPVYRISFSPTGRVLALERNGGVQTKLWDIAAGREIATLPDTKYITFSPDGEVLAAANSRGDEIALWNVSTGRRLSVFGVESKVMGVSFAAQGDVLTAWTEAGKVLFIPLRLEAWLRAGCDWLAPFLQLHPDRNVFRTRDQQGVAAEHPLCGSPDSLPATTG